VNVISAVQFGGLVAQEFPGLRDALARANGTLQLEIDEFAHFTQTAKVGGDWPTYERCVRLADRVLAGADAVLGEAFRAGFFGQLEFEGSRGPAAWQLLTPALQAAWKQMDAENRRLMALPQQRAPSAQPGRHDKRHGPSRGPKPKGPGGPSGPGGPRGARGSRGRRGPRGRGRGGR
jgi:hypothetical protein